MNELCGESVTIQLHLQLMLLQVRTNKKTETPCHRATMTWREAQHNHFSSALLRTHDTAAPAQGADSIVNALAVYVEMESNATALAVAPRC